MHLVFSKKTSDAELTTVILYPPVTEVKCFFNWYRTFPKQKAEASTIFAADLQLINSFNSVPINLIKYVFSNR